MPQQEPLRVARLTPDRRDDFLRFFDRLGYAGTRCEAAACYCHYYHLAPAIPWDSLDAAANRIAISARIDVGEMEGFLAYADESVIGWLNAQPYHKLAHLWSRLAVPPLQREFAAHETAAISCFVIHSSCQWHDVATTLLDAALVSLQQRGIRAVDAFPRRSDERSPAQHPNHGALALFLEAGFSVEREDRNITVVRRQF